MEELQAAFEEMFWLNSVDVVWQGHLHAYQRTCPAFNNTCIENAPDGSAQAPTYVTLGNAGFLLSPYQAPVKPAVFVKESMVIGWHRVTANATHFHEQALASRDGSLIDEFVLAKPAGWRPPSVAQRAAQLEGLPRQPPPPAGTDMAGWYVAYVKALPLLADLFKDKAAALLGPESVTWRLATGALPCCTMDVLFGSVAESAAFLNQTLGLVDDLAKLADRFNLTHNELYGLWEQYQAVTSYWLDGRIASFATEPTQPPGPNATDPIDAITS